MTKKANKSSEMYFQMEFSIALHKIMVDALANAVICPASGCNNNIPSMRNMNPIMNDKFLLIESVHKLIINIGKQILAI